MLRDISAHSTAYAARCKTFQLREWRRHGFLEGIGARDGKGHVFDAAEAVRIALAYLLARYGFGFREAFAFVSERGDQIDDLVRATSKGTKAKSDHILTFSIDQDLSRPFASITGAPLARTRFETKSVGALQVNVSHVVRDTVDRLAFHQNHGGYDE